MTNTPGTRRNRGSTGSGLLMLMFAGMTLTAMPGSGSERSEWRERMSPIVPQTYLCPLASGPIKVDGKLDEAAWAAAPWTSDFVDIEGTARPAPRLRTRAKMLWDENYLYVAAEIEEPHVWATLTNHDSVIFFDPDFEVFIDPDGDTHNYCEFEINALNTSWDLRLDHPYMDGGKPHDEWDIPGLKSAVQVRGTLNNPADTDQGWTVELAFPWKVLAEYATHAGPPREGEQWRINFSRVEWQVTTNSGRYEKVPKRAEDNWVWSPQGVIDMHRPEMWSVMQFTRQTGEDSRSVIGLLGKPARDVALEVYYAQRDFWKAHERWATNLADLGSESATLPADVRSLVLEPTPDGYVCSVVFTSAGAEHTWRIRQDRLLKLDQLLPLESETFIKTAAEKHGEAGRRAAWFLVDNMPARDRGILSSEFLLTNLDLALAARARFPWAKTVPERIYFNDVLPYVSLDEPRDPWRTGFYTLAGDLVKDCRTATEAAQTLNRELFKRLNVHYNLARKRNNQSPKESIEQGKATCTGLAIILVDACRAVGVPARVVGVPEWAHKQGNHTWVEIWDGDWFFTGADEYDKQGLNRGWFNADAARTVRSTNLLNQIYASSWRRTGEYFPLAWDLGSREVSALDVSARYASLAPTTNSGARVVHVRVREQRGGERVVAQVEMRSAGGAVLARGQTRAGRADLNDMPDFKLPADSTQVVFRVVWRGQVREHVMACDGGAESQTLDVAWTDLTPVSPALLRAEAWLARPLAERGEVPNVTLTRAEAERLVQMAWNDTRKLRAAAAEEELSRQSITVGDKTLKWMEKSFGDAPSGSRSLWITLHGGGQATAEENDRNWRGYYGRYEFPPGSINVAPRAPANTWDMWFVPWVDDLLDRLITDMVERRGVDPNRVYLIGYSAGGDGIYQLAPRLADRFAAVTMCAGHPNDAAPEGLRNLPFFLFMGGEDAAYHRNTVVREFSAKLDVLAAADPGGYSHRLTVYPGLQHNMQNREAEVIPRMAALQRVPWPRRVVWTQAQGSAHTRFYWLERPAQPGQPASQYAAHVEGQTLFLEAPSTGSLTLRLSDTLLDLDQTVRVVAAGRTVFEGKVARSFAAIMRSLQERGDPDSVAVARLTVSW